jgi:hypothetical protein
LVSSLHYEAGLLEDLPLEGDREVLERPNTTAGQNPQAAAGILSSHAQEDVASVVRDYRCAANARK